MTEIVQSEAGITQQSQGHLVLILMRHAQACAPFAVRDHDRSLTDYGRQQALQAGRWLKTQNWIPDQAIVSAAVRTHLTATLVQEGLGQEISVDLTESIYEAEPAAILRAIHGIAANHTCVLVCGHNPGISLLAAQLTGTASWDLIEQLQQGFAPGSLARLEFQQESWADIKLKSGRLSHFVCF